MNDNINAVRTAVHKELDKLECGYNSPLLGYITDYPERTIALPEFNIEIRTHPRGNGLLGNSGYYDLVFTGKDVTRDRATYIAGKEITQMILKEGEFRSKGYGIYNAYNTKKSRFELVIKDYNTRKIVDTRSNISTPDAMEEWLDEHGLYFTLKPSYEVRPEKWQLLDVEAYNNRRAPYIKGYFEPLDI